MARKVPSIVRTTLCIVLVLLAAVVALRHPVAPEEPWPSPQLFQPDEAECRVEREGRQWTFFELPETGEVATVAEVARKFNLETGWICSANGLPDDCGGSRLIPGERLVLPLHPRGLEGARIARREGGR